MKAMITLLALSVCVGCGGMEEDYAQLPQQGFELPSGLDMVGGPQLATPRLPAGLTLVPPKPLATSCPAKAPADGDACHAVSTLQCTGSGYVETCSGSYGGDRKCRCDNGTWNCPNIFCGSFCPKTLAAAKKAPACTKPQGEESSACYYSGGGLCSCSAGKISCM